MKYNIEYELNNLYPDVKCELEYENNPFHLLIMVMLSAQTTDKKVNQVSKILFDKYKTIDELSNANIDDVESIIRILGLSKVKAKRVVEIARIIKNKYDYKVPSEKEELITLPGVGVKTANVIRVEYFKEAEFPVDTHVHRVAKRLELIKENDDVTITESKLRKKFNASVWGKLHHQLIHFGRYKCKAINPECSTCPFKCKYMKIK